VFHCCFFLCKKEIISSQNKYGYEHIGYVNQHRQKLSSLGRKTELRTWVTNLLVKFEHYCTY